MQVGSKARGLVRVLRAPTFLNSNRFLSHGVPAIEAPSHSSRQQWRPHSAISSQSLPFSGIIRQRIEQHSMCSMLTARASFSSVEVGPTEAVKELYDKMLKSVVAQTMPPNAWLWSLIEKCENHEDIKLLFDMLQNLRRFRLSNLRIHENFNCNLCREVAKACARVGALDFGKKTLRKHNVYGLTPSIGSVHHLLLYAKKHNDVGLMVEVMKLLKRNDLPYQSGTADIVFSICYNTDNWQLISMYSKKFVKAGVKLRETTFDTWMEFAAKIGDTESLWKIEKLRSEMMKQHSLRTGFSCAKGFLLERKPDNASSIIQLLIQNLSVAKRAGVLVELQKLISEWSLEVVKRQKEEDRKALAASLITDIPVMVSGLQNMGLELSVSMEELSKEGALT